MGRHLRLVDPPAQPPARLWLLATRALGRDVPVDGPYPHVCWIPLPGVQTSKAGRLSPRDCATCAESTPAGHE